MPTLLPPLPLQDDVIDSAREPKITRAWSWWLRGLADRVQAAPAHAGISVGLTGQAASIALTSLILVPNGALYRVSWYLRITQAASTSSSLQVDILTTDGGIVVTQSGTAVTGNTTDTVQSGVVVVRCDAAAPLQYQTTYGSVGAAPMQYAIDLICEAL